MKRASLIYPQPIAIACGRVLRARSQSERLDACLKAAEVLARYVTATALSSFAARDGGADLNISPLDGNLSFGHFLSASQQVANIEVPHPAAAYLHAGFRPRKGQATGITYASLEALLTLRNELGHQLQAMTGSQAQAILDDRKPDTLLIHAMMGIQGLLSLPLFVVEEQQVVQRVIRARRLLLMGESADPAPDEIELAEALDDAGVPYIALGPIVLRLPPVLVWELVQQRANTRLLFLDRVAAQGCRYKTVEGDEAAGTPERAAEVAALCAGRARASERVQLRDGRHLAREWGEQRRLLEETGARGEGLIPWHLLSSDTVSWFVNRLEPSAEPPHSEVVCEHLLDGRTSIDAHERRQLVLLFGTDAATREELRRDIMDLQVISDPTKRWDERLLIDRGNLFGALRQALEFLTRHLSRAGLTFDGLTQTDGPPDYLAIREALMNLLIHQDYADQRTCARIILRSDETVLSNAGHSLVAVERLEEGGAHQARNPLVARALRLVGFAEIAGSGLRMLHTAWRGAHRPPPAISSDRDSNSFELRLDWRPAEKLYDEKWSRRGIKLTPAEVKIIDLAKSPGGVTLQTLCETLGLAPEAVKTATSHLVVQALIEVSGERYVIAEHWGEIS
ncbi:ATP-binding protein [Mesorhizobium sp. L103C131B0]|uniref:ATP-binding protein n=1 Tax=Mesorhizobium sp. L103C131B0 TaxID=1287089 RepID=UPI0018CB0DAE|nr:ATP-binding protein [Mesorhizobium sp. L103C131B0]